MSENRRSKASGIGYRQGNDMCSNLQVVDFAVYTNYPALFFQYGDISKSIIKSNIVNPCNRLHCVSSFHFIQLNCLP